MQQNATENRPGLADEVLAILRCLTCQSALDQRADGLMCASGGRLYPAQEGVVEPLPTLESPEVQQCAE